MSTFTLEELKKTIKEVVREEKSKNEHRFIDDDERIKHNVTAVCEDGKCYGALIKHMVENSDYECENCGLPLGSKKTCEEMGNCPACGYEGAKECDK